MELTLYILLGLLALLLGLLSVPLKLSLHLERDENSSVLRYGSIVVFDSSKVVAEKQSKPERPKRPRRSKKQKSSDLPLEGKKVRRSFGEYVELARQGLLLTPQVISALFRLGFRTLKRAKIENIEGFLGGGLDDPALTGELAGYGYALVGALPYRAKNFRIEPDYMAERLEYRLDTTVSFRLIGALGPSLQFFRELPKRKLYKLIKRIRSKTDSIKTE